MSNNKMVTVTNQNPVCNLLWRLGPHLCQVFDVNVEMVGYNFSILKTSFDPLMLTFKQHENLLNAAENILVF